MRSCFTVESRIKVKKAGCYMVNWDISTIFGVSDLDEKMYTDQQREGGEEGRKGSKGYLKKHTENPLVCLRKL
jgi:hypothetical protein